MNQKEKEKKKKKKASSHPYEFCKVCNLDHDQGNRHKYFPNHVKYLSSFLSRFQNKLADVRFFLKNPVLLRPEHAHRNRIWCVFCDSDVVESPSSSFACANVIGHLASADHLKKLKHFFWKYGGGMDRLDAFRILEADFDKWEKKCKSLTNEAASASAASAASSIDGSGWLQNGGSNDIHTNELKNENTNDFKSYNTSFNPRESNVSNAVMPLQYYTNEYQISNSAVSAVSNVCPASLPPDVHSGTASWNANHLAGNWDSQHPSSYNAAACSSNLGNGELFQVDKGQRMVMGVTVSLGSQNITQISGLVPQRATGNVHTGAPPPWFEATEENQLSAQQNTVPSSFLSLSNKPQKSKLNPKRVGAAWAEKRKIELEMEKRGQKVKSDCDATWLPNFGRVWQSGTRKESRKEFEKEKPKLPKVEGESEAGAIVIQPYISKRTRREAINDGSGDHFASE